MPFVQSACRHLPGLSDVGVATLVTTNDSITIFERNGTESTRSHTVARSALAVSVHGGEPPTAHLPFGFPIGAATALASATIPNKKDSLPPKAREYVVSFGGERASDGSGRFAPIADLSFIDVEGSSSTTRTVPTDLSSVWWPEPRKFAAAASVYRAGGFSIFDEDTAPEGRTKGKTVKLPLSAGVQPGAVAAGSGTQSSVQPINRKSSAGAVRDAASVNRDQAAEDVLTAALTGACVIVFGGVDAAGRLSDELLLLNVEAALADAPQPALSVPAPAVPASGKDVIFSSASSLPTTLNRRRWWVVPPRPDGLGPAGRIHHSLSVLPPGNAVALFGGYGCADGSVGLGGYSPEPSPLSDVWILDIQVRHWVSLCVGVVYGLINKHEAARTQSSCSG
jgi:hypothetical protein